MSRILSVEDLLGQVVPAAAPKAALDYRLTPTPVEGPSTALGVNSLRGVASDYLLSTLRAHGNEIGADHEVAVRALCELAELVLGGHLEGRFRFGLPCGMGKTTGVRSVVRALHLLGLPHRVAIACSKVEELCALKRTLVGTDGVPEEKVGLVHSYTHDPRRALDGLDGYASEPSEGHDRQVLLVTHANVRAGHERDWMAGRDLVFFDESLIVGEAQTLSLVSDSPNCVLYELGGLKAQAQVYPDCAEAALWFDSVVSLLLTAVKDHCNAEVRTVSIPAIDPETAGRFRRIRAFATERLPNLSMLLDLAERSTELRVFTNHERNRALVSYMVTVPDSLQNVIVLDASDPIRELVHHDPRMRRAEDVLDSLSKFRKVPGGLASIKGHSRVQIRFACDAGGRGSMSREFSLETSWAIEKLVRLIKSRPDESFLVFTYRDRDGVKYERTLIKALERAGIDTHAQDDDGNLRISILTWGRETATNEYAYVQNVVLLGVVFQPEESVAGKFLGQVDDLKAGQLTNVLRPLVYSEAAHAAYQAMNRGRMRKVDVIDGRTEARACNVWVWHRDSDFEDRIAPVLHGAPSWLPWREQGEGLDAQDLSRLIVRELSKLEEDGHSRVSLRQLKSAVAATVPNATWQRARDIALSRSPWSIDGRSLVRLFDAAA